MAAYAPRLLPGPPSRIVREGSDPAKNEAKRKTVYARYQLKIKCLILIDEDRRSLCKT